MSAGAYMDSSFSERFMHYQTLFHTQANSSPDILTFSGNAFSVKQKSEEIQIGDQKYKSYRINMSGAVLKTFDLCCYLTTIVLGAIFIFPLFMICCNWWKLRVFPLAKVDPIGYQGVCAMIQKSQVEEFYLMVNDNYFNESLAAEIRNALRSSRVRNFVFINLAIGIDAVGKNYSDFERYMRPIKNLIYQSEIKWASTIIL